MDLCTGGCSGGGGGGVSGVGGGSGGGGGGGVRRGIWWIGFHWGREERERGDKWRFGD